MLIMGGKEGIEKSMYLLLYFAMNLRLLENVFFFPKPIKVSHMKEHIFVHILHLSKIYIELLPKIYT